MIQEIADKIKEEFTRLNIDKKEAAEQIGCNFQTLGNFFKKPESTTFRNLAGLADQVGLELRATPKGLRQKQPISLVFDDQGVANCPHGRYRLTDEGFEVWVFRDGALQLETHEGDPQRHYFSMLDSYYSKS